MAVHSHIQRGRVSAYPVSAVDETAAGDAFIGYLMAGLLQQPKQGGKLNS